MIIDPYTYYKIIFDINLHGQRGWTMAVSDDASNDYYDSYSRKVWIGKLYSNWKIIHVGQGNWQFIVIGGKFDGWKVGIQTSPKEKNISWVKLVNGDQTGTYWKFITPDKQFNDTSRLIIQNAYNNQYLCAHRGRNQWKRQGQSTFLITHANIKMGADQIIWNIQANGGSSVEEKKNLTNAQLIENLQGKLTKAQQDLTYFQKRCQSLEQELNQTSSSYQSKVNNLSLALNKMTQNVNSLTESYNLAKNDVLKYSQLYNEEQESAQKKSKQYDELLSNFYQYKNAVDQNQQQNQMSLEALRQIMKAKEELQGENRQMREELISLRNKNIYLNQYHDEQKIEIQKHLEKINTIQNQLEIVKKQKQNQYWKFKGQINSAQWNLTSSKDQFIKFKTDFQSKHQKVKKNYQIKANFFRNRLAQTMKPTLTNFFNDLVHQNQINRLNDQNSKLRNLLQINNIQIPVQDQSWLSKQSLTQQNQHQKKQEQSGSNMLGGIFKLDKQKENEMQNIIDKLENQYKAYLADSDKRQQIQRQKQMQQSNDRISQMQMNWTPNMVFPKQINWWTYFSHPELVYKNGLAKNVLQDDDVKRIALTNTYFHPFNNPKPNVWLTFKIKKLKTWMAIGIIQCPQSMNFNHSWCEFDHKQIVSKPNSGMNMYYMSMGTNMENPVQSDNKETIDVISPQKRTFYMLTSSGKQLYNLKQGNCSVNDAPFKFQTGDEITIYYNTMRGSIMFEKGKESFQIRNIDTHPGENYVFVAVMEGLGSEIEIKDYQS